MKVYVTVQNYGGEKESENFCDVFNKKTLFHAFYVKTITDSCNIIIEIRDYEIGQLFSVIKADPLFNWVEYTVQFEL